MSIGIDIARLRLLAFVVSAAMGGLAGSLYVHTIGVVSPAALEFPVMVTCLTIAVIGGRFRVAGAVVGAVLLYNLPEFLRFLDKYYLMAYGAATLAMVVVAPDGLVGALERLRRHWFPEVPAVAPPALTPSPPQFPVADRHPSSLLEIVNLDKRFGGVHAVNRVSLTIGRGEIVGIIGPNGSGKTTLINLITGIYRADSGTVRFRGRDISRTATHVIAAAGIARTFQRSHLVATMTALDNVAVARFAGPRRHGARFDLARARGEAMALLDRLGVADDAMRPCGTLTYGRQRLVEIARGLALAPALMLLDEPAAGLTEVEQADLAGRLRTLVEDGLTLVVIEHAMPFLMPLADRLICLDDGRVIASGPPREVRRDPRVIAAYLGTGRAAKETPT
jgi:branched-chain amino acid transport system permease protein